MWKALVEIFSEAPTIQVKQKPEELDYQKEGYINMSENNFTSKDEFADNTKINNNNDSCVQRTEGITSSRDLETKEEKEEIVEIVERSNGEDADPNMNAISDNSIIFSATTATTTSFIPKNEKSPTSMDIMQTKVLLLNKEINRLKKENYLHKEEIALLNTQITKTHASLLDDPNSHSTKSGFPCNEDIIATYYRLMTHERSELVETLEKIVSDKESMIWNEEGILRGFFYLIELCNSTINNVLDECKKYFGQWCFPRGPESVPLNMWNSYLAHFQECGILKKIYLGNDLIMNKWFICKQKLPWSPLIIEWTNKLYRNMWHQRLASMSIRYEYQTKPQDYLSNHTEAEHPISQSHYLYPAIYKNNSIIIKGAVINPAINKSDPSDSCL